MSERHQENRDTKTYDFSEFTLQSDDSVLAAWTERLKSMPEADWATLVIYLIKSSVDKHDKAIEEKIECTLATNAEGQLVAFDKEGKNKFILEGRKVEVPASTLAILNKPTSPPITGLDRK